MRLKIELYATLREKFKRREIEVEAENLKEALERVAEFLGKEFLDEVFDNENLRKDRIIIVNGEIVRDVRDFADLKNGDKIAIFPPLIGG